MKITQVIIKNWRSIKYVDFKTDAMNIFVGANNAGKTNIMSAINFLLGDRYPMPANLLDSDYFLCDKQRDIFIQIDFESEEYSRIDFDTSREKYALKAYGKDGRQSYGFNNEHRASLAFAYVDANRSFEKQFGSSRWSLFGQAIRILHANLLAQCDDRLPSLRDRLEQAHELLKTDLYLTFEKEIREAFRDQLKTSRYDLQFEFRTIDETNLYRTLFPTLSERNKSKSTSETGSGVRNLLVLALFHAFARAFKGGAILGIEEPELFLHPHAQRSLMGQFESLVAEGNQLFVSSHSSAFLDITRPERIIVVETRLDEEGEYSTLVRTTTQSILLAKRQQLHPSVQMNENTMRAFLRNIRTAEMAEPYFSRLVIIVEGESEREALPVFCEKLGINFDKLGISIVAAGGKSSIDILAQVYQAHQIPVYIVFDNDKGRRDSHASNRVLCRLLNIIEADTPNPQITDKFAVMDGDWESQMSNDLEVVEAGLYLKLELEARQYLGIGPKKNKSLVARYIALQLVNRNIVPDFVERIGGHLRNLAEELDRSDVPFDENSHAQPKASSIEQVDDQWDNNLPF